MASTRHPRSRTGCWICRLRKKKCDEARPTCQQCRNLKIQCDGYGISQPTWMRDPVAAKRKKEEIKLQIGKRGRRRRKARPRISEELGSGAKENNKEVEALKEDKGSLGDGSVTKAVMKSDDVEGTTCENDNRGNFVFEITESGIQLLKPFLEAPEIYASGAVAMLDSPHPPMGCYRCPIKNSFAKTIDPAPSYGIIDALTGKPLLQDVISGVILAPKLPPLWKPNNLTVPNTRTKEEEIANGEYDAIIASLVSLATPKHRVSLSPAELSDPSLVPPISFGDAHESILMRHYIRNLFRLTYSGMSEPRIRESLREVFVPLVNVNPGLLKACLSSSAMHLAATESKSEAHAKALIKDAWAHRVDCVRDLRQRLKDGASEESLASILALTSFEIYSSLPNWKHHLQAAIECLVQLDLLNKPAHSASSKFLMSRVIWMDILSSLTLGRTPQLWANYREILSRPVHERAYYGLLEIMGCDDTVMFLVSEVMCVEDYKYRTLKDGMISWTRGCKRAIELDVRLRDRDLPIAMKLPPSPEPPSLPLPPSHEDEDGNENDPTGLLASSPLSIPSPSPTASSQSPGSAADGDNAHTPHYSFSQPSSPLYTAAPTSPTTAAENAILSTSEEHILSGPGSFDENSIPPELPVDQDMIIKATTAAFRTATRIHLWSVGLGFYPRLNFFQQLLEELIVMVALIPTKSSRTVTWPLLVGGCMATEEKDREFFAGRCAIGHGGSLGGIGRIMREVWRRRDETDRTMGVGCGQEVHWRNVMREEGLEILLV